MDRRSWLWRKRSSEKSPGETESSGSMSSYSERLSDEQANLTYSTQSPEVSSVAAPDDEENEKIKALTDKLSAALSDITAKEELVIQHAKVAEEAVAGWERADREVSGLKLQLDAALKKNSTLDGALKECVRQLRQGKEEQERKIEEAIAEREHEWESRKSELENQLSELRTQLEAAKSEEAERGNESLRLELVSLSKKLEIATLESDLSTKTAEAASKQHLESVKKVAKLEAECRMLRFFTRKTSLLSENSQSDHGDKLRALEANVHIGESDQFKGEKGLERKPVTRSSESVLMDDFLEMERLAALPDTANEPVPLELGESPLKAEIQTMITRNADLEGRIRRLEAEKLELERELNTSQSNLRTSEGQLKATKNELISLQHQLFECRDQLRTSQAKLKGAKTELIELETQLIEHEDQLSASEAHLKDADVKLEELQNQLIEREDQLNTSQGQLKDAEATLMELQLKLNEREEELKRSQGQANDIESQLLEMKTRMIEYEDKLEKSQGQMKDGDTKLIELQAELSLMNKLKEGVEEELDASIARREEAELQVKALESEVKSLVDEAEKERALSAEITAKCRKLDAELSKRKLEPQFQLEWNCNAEMKAEQEMEIAVAASRLADCQKTIASLGRQLQSLATLDDFLVDADNALEFSGESPVFFRTGELGNPPSIDCQ